MVCVKKIVCPLLANLSLLGYAYVLPVQLQRSWQPAYLL
jgi:hypothetical protein